MLKASICLLSSITLGLVAAPKAAVASNLSPAQCRTFELNVVQYIQANSPVIGSYAYHQYWTGIVPQILMNLEQAHSECSFWDQRPLTDADVRSGVQSIREGGQNAIDVIRLME